MSAVHWDPAQYARYATERDRPFHDLVARVGADHPARVLDLGCGTGALTRTLVDRWPGADVRGLDASPEMVAAAVDGVRVELGRAEDLDARGLDVLVSNATLQWVPGHRELLVRWTGELEPGGWLAFQVPANGAAPLHALMRQLAADPRWADRLAGVLRDPDDVAEPAAYLELLAGAGMAVDAWETTYLHVLPGEDAVLDWVRGTGLRPVLGALGEDAGGFVDAYAALLRDAYPRGRHGTVLPFRRTFVVAHRR